MLIFSILKLVIKKSKALNNRFNVRFIRRL